jgi:hypothetical protein
MTRQHDLTRVNYSFTPRDGGQSGWIASWSAYRSEDKPRPGDWVLLRNGDRSSRYRVLSVDRCLNVDPPTMWTAQLVFDPRTYADRQQN